MYQSLPQTITVTELQRNPKIIDRLNRQQQEAIIIKGSKQVGVYTPIQVHQEFLRKLKEAANQTAAVSQKENDMELKKDLELIKSLAGGIKLKVNATPEELNKMIDDSYEMLP